MTRPIATQASMVLLFPTERLPLGLIFLRPFETKERLVVVVGWGSRGWRLEALQLHEDNKIHRITTLFLCDVESICF